MLETRTLCLTDVVDSTKLATEIGDTRNGALWDAHDALARALVAQWRGTELERTDGIMVLFDSPADALGFAVAYHAAVRTLDPPLVARAGIHTGPLAIRPNPADHVARGAKRLEVDGLAIAITARVMSVAVGGQTLVTFIPEAPLRTVSHGHWQLKGIASPVELFEVGLVGTPPLAPPPDAAKAWRVVWRDDTWLPVRDIPHSLPAQRDAFVGRETELQDLARRLDEGSRLVSVLGIGGTGKTRLVTRFAWTWLGEWPGGVWFCDLSEARSVDGIVSAVARALDVPLGKDDPVVQLGHAIAGRGRCLVVLDNFEQVARHAAETVGRWLDRASLGMVDLPGRVVECRADVGGLEIRELLQDLILGKPRGEQVEHVHDPDPHSAYARVASPELWARQTRRDRAPRADGARGASPGDGDTPVQGRPTASAVAPMLYRNWLWQVESRRPGRATKRVIGGHVARRRA